MTSLLNPCWHERIYFNIATRLNLRRERFCNSHQQHRQPSTAINSIGSDQQAYSRQPYWQHRQSSTAININSIQHPSPQLVSHVFFLLFLLELHTQNTYDYNWSKTYRIWWFIVTWEMKWISRRFRPPEKLQGLLEKGKSAMIFCADFSKLIWSGTLNIC